MAVEIAEGSPLVYISFSAEIIPTTTESLIAAMATCAIKHVHSVCLLMSTPGGSVMNGMNLYNVLRGMPFELSTHNVGNVDSIGNAVFLAGTKRYATYNATFMFHGVGYSVEQKVRLEEKDCREKLDGILNDQQRIGLIMTQHTRLTNIEIPLLFREARTKDVSYAIEKGIIDEIRDVQISPGCPIISFVFNR